MNFPSALLPESWLWWAHLLYALTLLWALRRSAWDRLRDSADAHVLFGAYLALWLVWRIAAADGVAAGMEFHLLLVTTLTLMFGWPFAVLGVSVAQLGLSLGGQAEWASYSLNTLVNGVVPVAASYWTYRLVDRWLPKHFFIYIYLSAFFAGALAIALSRLVGGLLLLYGGVHSSLQLENVYWPIIPVILFPEAFLNGALMTVLVAFRPQWVSSFLDEKYLHGK